MEIMEELEFNFYRLRKHMGKKMYKEIMSVSFDELEKYEPVLCGWIATEIIEKVKQINEFFENIRLYDTDLKAKMFLRLYYASECEKMKRIK